MANIWHESAGGWAPTALTGDLFTLPLSEGVVMAPCPPDQNLAGKILLRLYGETGARKCWLLLAPPDAPVRINGARIPTGVRVLRDHDEIRLGGPKRLFFSTERLACTEPFPGLAQEASCPRCRLPMEIGRPAVRCPKCDVWHHESKADDRACWSYTDACGSPHCDQPTQFSDGFRWTPDSA